MSGMRYQPQGQSKVNMSHPLAAGLVDVWVPHATSFGLLTGYDSDTRSVGSNKVTPEGVGYNLTSVPRKYSTALFNGQSIAWLVVAYRDGSGNQSNSLVKKDGTVIAVQEWSGDVRSIMWTPGLAANISYGSAASMRNKMCVFAGLVGPSEKGVMFNGGNFNAFTGGGTTVVSTSNAFAIGGDARGTEVGSQWTVLAVFAWQGDRLPTSVELRELSANPWQLFAEPEEEELAATAAVNYMLSVSSTNMAASGGQVGMKVSRLMRAAPASLTLSPGVVAVRAARQLSIAPAMLAIAGGDIAVRAARRLSVAPASMGMTSSTVEMLYSPRPEPGSYTISVSAAAITLVGGNVGMRVARRLRITPASLALAAGAVRTLVGRRLMVSPAGLQLAGGPVTLRFSARGEPFDISKIHPSRLVIFEGSGSRITPFEGSGSRITPFEGSGSRITRFE